MIFDHDLARKFLLAIENSNNIEGIPVLEQKNFAKRSNVDDEQLAYTILMLNEAGFITNKPMFIGGSFYSYFPTQLTYSGHEYLDTVRSPEVWRKSKVIASKVGTVGLELMGQIAKNVISNILNPK